MRSLATLLRQFLVPNGILFVASVVSLHRFVPGPAAATVAPWLAMAIFAIAALLAWRFRTWRALLAIILFALAERAVALGSGASSFSSVTLLTTIALLLPINAAVLLLVDDPSFDWEAFGWWAGLVLVQVMAVAVLCRTEMASMLDWVGRPVIRSLSPGALPQLPIVIFLLAGLAQGARFAITRKPVDSGLFWAMCCGLVGLAGADHGSASAYFAASGVMLGAAVVETSYLIAFYDELTGLPGRRAFNQAVAKLRGNYAIAVVDVDHFKKFNDTFGHDVGDQVLRMVASKLARVTGHGAAFRCGGEEFNIVFRGQNAEDACEHAERLRQTIAESAFVVRGPDRSQRPRQERRYGHVKRKERAQACATSVTVSIGLASPADGAAVDDVIRTADRALYRAKAEGRNRVVVHRVPHTSKVPLAKRGSPVTGD